MTNYLDYTDEAVLDAVGTLGPAMVGHYLFERAEYLRTVALNNTLGPEARAFPFTPSEAAMRDLEARGMVRAIEVAVAPVPPSDGAEDAGELAPVKRGPGRPRKGT